MHVVTFASAKGGSGKTTLCASVGVAAAESGERGYLIDLDPQRSLYAWGERREAEEPAIDRIDVGQLEKALTVLRSRGYSLAMIDTAGFDTGATGTAMRLADLVLVPARPSSLDIQGIRPTLRSLEALGKAHALILNACPSTASARITDASRALSLLGKLGPIICQRVDHLDAITAGLGVTEYRPDGAAATETRNLWAWIKKKLEGAHEEAASVA
jgi:chromosome partitioning protein